LIIVGSTLLGVLVAVGVSAFTQPQYVATTRLFVTTTGGASVVEAYQGNLFGQERVVSYAQLARGNQVAQRAIDQLHINLTPAELMSMIKAEAVPNTVLLDVSVSNANPTVAKDLANAVALQTTQLVEELETSVRGGSPAASATLVDAADQPTSPATPQWIPNILFGLLGGLLFGLTAAIAVDKLDRSVTSTEDAASAAGAPPIGTLPKSPRHRDGGASIGSDRGTTEAFRSLRTNVLATQEPNSTGAIVVGAPTRHGRSGPVTYGLGTAIAETGRSVVIVDADLEIKPLSAELGIDDDTVGLTDVLTGAAPFDDTIFNTSVKGLAVLPAGAAPEAGSVGLVGQPMLDLLKSLCAEFDIVLINCPPLLTQSDGLAIGEWTDGLVLVAKLGTTTATELSQSADRIRAANVHVVGVVGEAK